MPENFGTRQGRLLSASGERVSRVNGRAAAILPGWPRGIARIVGGAGCAGASGRSSPLPGTDRGGGAPRGASNRSPRFASAARTFRHARLAALHRGVFRMRVTACCHPGPRLRARARRRGRSASSSRTAPSGHRAGSGAARVRGYEPRAQAPRPFRHQRVSR